MVRRDGIPAGRVDGDSTLHTMREGEAMTTIATNDHECPRCRENGKVFFEQTKVIFELTARCAEYRKAQEWNPRLRAIVGWLEANQPDVFRRGLWDAISKIDLPAPPGKGEGT